MNRSQKAIIDSFKIPADLTAVSLAWVAAYFLRFHSFFHAPKGIPEFGVYGVLIPFLLAIWWGSFQLSGFYERSQRRRSAVMEALDIIQSCLLATLVFIAFSYFFDDYIYSRLMIAIFGFLQVAFLISSRSLLRKWTRRWLSQIPLRKVLLIGSDDNFRSGIELIQSGAFGRCQPLAINLDPSHKETVIPANWQTVQIELDEVADFVVENEVSGLMICISNQNAKRLQPFLERWSQEIHDIQILPDITEYRRFGAGVEIVDSKPLISVHRSPLEGRGAVLKRLMDIVGGIAALLLFSPIMILSAVLVKLSSKGPVFYRQERMSLDGHKFDILKFRSMPTNSESSSGAIWAKASDGRATRIGSFLRKTSLDELPQLFNVLGGSMSLVGPRPERPVFVNQFRRQIPGYMVRHNAKAGMTGWAQINGWRGNTSIEKRIECDLFYIQNWSIVLDIKIMVLTVFKGFVNNNAY